MLDRRDEAEELMRRAQAAVAELGYPPESFRLVTRHGGWAVAFDGAQIPVEVVWKARSITVSDGFACCRACYVEHRGLTLDCEAESNVEMDCGRRRG